MKTRLILPFLISTYIVGCLTQPPAPVVARGTNDVVEMQGVVKLKGFDLYLDKQDGSEIQLDTKRILDTPVTIRGVQSGSGKDAKFEVWEVKN